MIDDAIRQVFKKLKLQMYEVEASIISAHCIGLSNYVQSNSRACMGC